MIITGLSILLTYGFIKSSTIKVEYPKTKKVEQVDDYFGTKVSDPYRWLENDTAAETAEWVKAQNKVTFGYLEQIPFRDKIKQRLTKIWNFPKFGVPFREGNFYFFFKNDGMQNQSVLYIQDGLEGEPKVFLDPNTFSKDGTIALSDVRASKDAKYMAYTTSVGGSDWNEISIVEIPSGKKLVDQIKWVKFSGIAWEKDGFYYSRYDEPKKGGELSGKNEFHKVYYHKIGTLQSKDSLIYENPKYPLRNYSVSTTEDERFLFLYESEGTSGNSIYLKELSKSKSSFVLVAKGFDYDYNAIDNDGDKILILTNNKAPKNRLIVVPPPYTDTTKWQNIIPEQIDVLQSVTLIGGKIVAQYMKDASSRAYLFDMKGNKTSEIVLPGIGTLGGLNGKKNDLIAFYAYTSFTFPTTIFKYDFKTCKSEIFKKPDIDFNANEYETKQVFYSSVDGSNIPMFIVHKKGIKLDGTNPTMLYGYGGFNVSLTPSFSLSRLIFLENGGVYAVANLRGGGEYGEEWHKAGIKLYKQNVFDDFIAAAEYLISEKYTSSSKLAISGGSNGGLLVGACMTQRPELFKVALPAVGVMDMLRFHKFTIGWAWVSDYGSSEDPNMFKYLYGYSPLHNIKEGVSYPATMVTTADHDDRVVPAHSFKFIATLQEKHKGDNPVLIRIETMAGHGAGKPTAKQIDESTDFWAFVLYNLCVTPIY
jgi:prolyl oligopeptidase